MKVEVLSVSIKELKCVKKQTNARGCTTRRLNDDIEVSLCAQNNGLGLCNFTPKEHSNISLISKIMQAAYVSIYLSVINRTI